MFWVEMVGTAIMGMVGSYLLYRGKKIQEPKLMLWGAVLLVLSYWLFSGTGKNAATSKDVSKMLLSQTQDQIPQ